MKTVLVTGSADLIDSEVVEFFIERDFRLVRPYLVYIQYR